MKVSFVSSQAISQAMRYQMMRMQTDLVKANKEMVTLRVADPGLVLGGRTGVAVSLQREIERLEGLIDSNALASSRLDSIQVGLKQITDDAGDLIGHFMTAYSGASDPKIAKQEAESMLSMLTSVLNGNLNGEHLYAGINTDVKPLADFLDPTSQNRIEFDLAFNTYFGFDADDPAAEFIAAADMKDFLDTVIEPQIVGAGWAANWSTATDQQITSRITLTETAQTSVSANIPGFRKLAMAAATIAATFGGPLGRGARDAALDKATELLGQVIVELGSQQGYTGITQQRIEKANERMSMQIDLFKLSLHSLEGIDEYEVATRVSGLMAQLEISYSLTARMQQLSLLKYLR